MLLNFRNEKTSEIKVNDSKLNVIIQSYSKFIYKSPKI